MTNAELLQLNPQHLAELSDLLAGLDFVDVEIVAMETAFDFVEVETAVYGYERSKLKFDSVFRGKKNMHAVFIDGKSNDFYCFSFAKIGNCEERIIFKLIK